MLMLPLAATMISSRVYDFPMPRESRSRANLVGQATPRGCRDFMGSDIAQRPQKWTGKRHPRDILATFAGVGRWT